LYWKNCKSKFSKTLWYINGGVCAVAFLTFVIGIGLVISLKGGIVCDSGGPDGKLDSSENVDGGKNQLADSPLVLLTKQFVKRFEPKKPQPKPAKKVVKPPNKVVKKVVQLPKKVVQSPKKVVQPPKKVVAPPKFIVDMVVDVGEVNKLVWLKLPGKPESKLYVLGEIIENYTFIDIIDGKVAFEREGAIFKLDFPRVQISSHVTAKEKPVTKPKPKSTSSSRRPSTRTPTKKR
jgi:hypothetical protein